MNEGNKEKLLLIIPIVIIYLMIAMIYEFNISVNGNSLVLISVFLVLIIIMLLSSHLVSLYITLLSVAVYGTFLLYLSYHNKTILIGSYMFLILTPIALILTSKYSKFINDCISQSYEAELLISQYSLIDVETGLSNQLSFKNDILKQVSFAKRFNSDLAIIGLKIDYFEELSTFYNQDQVRLLIKQFVSELQRITRIEDIKYRLDKNLFIMVVSNIDKNNIEIIKDKIKKNRFIVKISLDADSNETISLDLKVGYIMYDNESLSVSNLIKRVKKELLYDV